MKEEIDLNGFGQFPSFSCDLCHNFTLAACGFSSEAQKVVQLDWIRHRFHRRQLGLA
jgi:hypothetical protein